MATNGARMVASDSKRVKTHTPGRFFYLCGCDGTGKSTQTKQLLAHLEAQGIEPTPLWLRFPFFLSLPLLLYARWRGLSWYEEHEGVGHGYWNFRSSWLLRHVLPWTLLFDAAWAALRKIYWPLWRGKTIVCERFVFDMLIDLEVGCHDATLHQRLPGQLYRYLLPKKSKIVLLDLDAPTIRQRRADLQSDKRLDLRLERFRALAKDYDLTVLSSQLSITELANQVQEAMGLNQNG